MSDPEDAPRQSHEGESIRLSELADEQGVVRNHGFLRCEILGPALVVLSGVYFNENRIDGFPDGCIYDVGEDRQRWVGAIIVDGCPFESCTFSNVGFTGPPEDLRAMKDSISSL